MNAKLRFVLTIVFISISVVFMGATHSLLAGESKADLKKQIETLQKRVEELESQQIPQNNTSWNFFQHRQKGAWDPFTEMRRTQNEIDHMFKNSFDWGGKTSRGMFRSNVFYDDEFGIREEKDKYIVEFDMNGLNQEKIDIQLNGRVLTVKGERSEEKNEEQKNRYFSSKSYATFMRSIVIPNDADSGQMRTEQQGGKLIITLPKRKT